MDTPKWIQWVKISERGHLMTLEEFIEDCESRCLIDYDGWGYYSDGKGMVTIPVFPSDVTEGDIDKTFTHVVWFNR